MDECDWVQCIDPPSPPGLNLDPNWDGITPYEFGSNATYTCKGSGYYFDEDRDKMSFNVTCLPGGRWQVPNPWPFCVTSENRVTTAYNKL